MQSPWNASCASSLRCLTDRERIPPSPQGAVLLPHPPAGPTTGDESHVGGQRIHNMDRVGLAGAVIGHLERVDQRVAEVRHRGAGRLDDADVAAGWGLLTEVVILARLAHAEQDGADDIVAERTADRADR